MYWQCYILLRHKNDKVRHLLEIARKNLTRARKNSNQSCPWCVCAWSFTHLIVFPLTTHWQLYVCGETSWWTGHALALEHSYNNPPCTKTDWARQFSTVWGCGGVAGIGESCWVSSVEAAGCCRLSSWWFSSSELLMQPLSCSTCCSSAEILWTSDSQLSAHWLLVWQSYEGGGEEGESLRIYCMN